MPQMATLSSRDFQAFCAFVFLRFYISAAAASQAATPPDILFSQLLFLSFLISARYTAAAFHSFTSFASLRDALYDCRHTPTRHALS